MKYQVSPSFVADFDRLPDEHKVLFYTSIRAINAAYAGNRGSGPPRWPKKLLIKAVEDSHGVWEMTWSFAGPDGRATFEYFDAGEGEVGIRWRRIGGHEIFRDP